MTQQIQSDIISDQLPDGWVETTVQNLVDNWILDKPIDWNHWSIHPKSSDFVSEGIPFIMASDLEDGKILYKNCAFISSEQNNSLQKWFAKPWDILLSHKATIGRTAIVDNTYESITLTPQLTYYRVIDAQKLDNKYLYYYFNSQFFQSILWSWAGSWSTRAYLWITDQRKLPIILPPLPEQVAIASLLSSFDDKIELLREENKTLEQTAQTIFQEWFGKYGVEDELPEGWRVGKLGDVVDHIKHSCVPSNTPTDFFYHYSLPAFDDWRKPTLEKWELILSNKYKVISDSFLVSKLNPSTPRIWTIFSPDKNSICSTEFQVLAPKNTEYFSFCHCFLNSQNFTDELSQKAHGTSSSHQRVTPQDILGLNIITHTESVIEFNNEVMPLLKKISNNNIQIQSLSQTRDELLPKLMKGEVKVEF